MKSTSALTLLAAAGLFAAGAATGPSVARAADLGGDCCADLEERVAELEATTARKGNRKVSLTVTGRVNYNIMYWNENSTGPGPTGGANQPSFDSTSGTYFGNVTRNESEIVFKGSGKITSDISAGFSMEIYADPDVYEAPNLPVGAVGQPVSNSAATQIGSQNLASPLARTEYVYVSSKTLGEVRLGGQYGAMHESWYSDLGTDVIGKYGQTREAMRFYLRDTKGNLVNINYQAVLKPMEDSRDNGILYVSPVWNGFNFRASVLGNTTYAGEALYNNKFGTVGVSAAVGYEDATNADGDTKDQSCAYPAASSYSTWTGVGCQSVQPKSSVFALTTAGQDQRVLAASASISESTSGLFLTGEYSKGYANNALTPGREDADNWMVKGGWSKNVSGLGNTAFYGSYFKQDNLLANDTTGHMWAAGVDQSLDSVASDLYLQYQRISYDTDGAALVKNVTINSQSIDEVIGGMIVRF